MPLLPKAVIEHSQDPPPSDVIRSMIYNARDREEYAKRVDFKGSISPHRFRHAGVTGAMIRVNGNLALMMAYSRHSDPANLLVYYDRHRYQQDRYAAMQAILTGQLAEQDAEFTIFSRRNQYGR
ncbi:MAG: hypothetical protein JW849_07445 [Phycisphaerae bacterium]|nr:hypothetical protein [Phycisphaerae bacterium]